MIVQKDPDISVVFNTHDDAQANILAANLKSLESQLDVRIEVICLDSTQSGAKAPDSFKLIKIPRDMPGNTAINHGLKEAGSKNSKYVFIYNDDVVLNKFCLKEMMIAIRDQELVLQAFGNTDNGQYFHAEMPFGLEKLEFPQKTFLTYQEIEPFVDQIINWVPSLRLINLYPNLCMWASLIPMKVWNKTKWPEDYIIGWADHDYSFQCRDLKIPMGICFSALGIHLGGATTSKESSDEIRKKDMDTFEKKWNVKIERPEHLK